MNLTLKKALVANLLVLGTCMETQSTGLRQVGFGSDIVIVTIQNSELNSITVATVPYHLRLEPDSSEPSVPLAEKDHWSFPKSFEQRQQLEDSRFVTLAPGKSQTFELNIRQIIEFVPERKIPIGKYTLHLGFEVQGRDEPLDVSGPFERAAEADRGPITGELTDIPAAGSVQQVQIINDSAIHVQVAAAPFRIRVTREGVKGFIPDIGVVPELPSQNSDIVLNRQLQDVEYLPVPPRKSIEFETSVPALVTYDDHHFLPGEYRVTLSYELRPASSVALTGRIKIRG